MPPAETFRLPDDPLELTIFLDQLRVRILPLIEALEITHEETEMLQADYAALTYAVRATEEAEILAGEWLEYQTQLLHGEEAPLIPPTPTWIPRTSATGKPIIRETRGTLYPRVRAGMRARLQDFIDRLIAHPNMTDRILLDLGLLGEATLGFSAGQGA